MGVLAMLSSVLVRDLPRIMFTASLWINWHINYASQLAAIIIGSIGFLNATTGFNPVEFQPPTMYSADLIS
jgi:hypothetical protein